MKKKTLKTKKAKNALNYSVEKNVWKFILNLVLVFRVIIIYLIKKIDFGFTKLNIDFIWESFFNIIRNLYEGKLSILILNKLNLEGLHWNEERKKRENIFLIHNILCIENNIYTSYVSIYIYKQVHFLLYKDKYLSCKHVLIFQKNDWSFGFWFSNAFKFMFWHRILQKLFAQIERFYIDFEFTTP